jgi:hypothetical protein
MIAEPTNDSRPNQRDRAGSMRRLLQTIACLVVTACTLLSPYDPTSYKNATDLKAESLALLEHATEPYASHAQEAEQLKVKLLQAYEYEHGKGKDNSDTAHQWEIMVNKKGAMIGGVLELWQKAGQLSPAAVPEFVNKISEGFDEIITLEQAKVKK